MPIAAKQGLPAPFVEVRAMTDTGCAPWDGATMGELQVRGPWIAASYYKLATEADKWTDDGWFRTGDVATIDAEGYVKITDRTKDLIKSGGEWISSLDLENALTGHPAVQEAAVIGDCASEMGRASARRGHLQGGQDGKRAGTEGLSGSPIRQVLAARRLCVRQRDSAHVHRQDDEGGAARAVSRVAMANQRKGAVVLRPDCAAYCMHP